MSSEFSYLPPYLLKFIIRLKMFNHNTEYVDDGESNFDLHETLFIPVISICTVAVTICSVYRCRTFLHVVGCQALVYYYCT